MARKQYGWQYAQSKMDWDNSIFDDETSNGSLENCTKQGTDEYVDINDRLIHTGRKHVPPSSEAMKHHQTNGSTKIHPLSVSTKNYLSSRSMKSHASSRSTKGHSSSVSMKTHSSSGSSKSHSSNRSSKSHSSNRSSKSHSSNRSSKSHSSNRSSKSHSSNRSSKSRSRSGSSKGHSSSSESSKVHSRNGSMKCYSTNESKKMHLYRGSPFSVTKKYPKVSNLMSDEVLLKLRYSCHLCPFITRSRFHFGMHLAEHKTVFTKHLCKVTADREHTRCSVCGYYADGEDDHKKHSKMHENNKQFVCTYCLKDFTYYFEAESHLKDCHSSRNYARHIVDRHVLYATLLYQQQKSVQLDTKVELEDYRIVIDDLYDVHDQIYSLDENNNSNSFIESSSVSTDKGTTDFNRSLTALEDQPVFSLKSSSSVNSMQVLNSKNTLDACLKNLNNNSPQSENNRSKQQPKRSRSPANR